MVSLLWSFGSKNWGSEAGCLCVTGDTNILHHLAVTLEWLLSYTCRQTHSQDDARENDESRDRTLTRVTEEATKVVARLQSVNKNYILHMSAFIIFYGHHRIEFYIETLTKNVCTGHQVHSKQLSFLWKYINFFCNSASLRKQI